LGQGTWLCQIPNVMRVFGRHRQLVRWWWGSRVRRLSLARECWFGLDGDVRPPRSVSLRPTFLCNLNCVMCAFANSAADGDMPITRASDMLPLEVAKRLTDDLAPHHTCLTVTGGEPFLWPPMFELFDYARSRGVLTTVTTNGTLLVRRIDDLKASPPDVVVVSVLGPEEVHDSIVGLKGAFSRIVEGLHLIDEAKGGDRLARPLLIVNTPIIMENAEALPSVVSLGRRWPILANHFQHLWFTTPEMRAAQCEVDACPDGVLSEGIALEAESVDPARIWHGIRQARVESRGHPVLFYPDLTRRQVETYYRRPTELVTRDRAICAWIFSHVLPSGEVSPCLGVDAGNLHHAPFLRVWNSDRLRDFRRVLRERGSLPICARCCVFFRND